MKSSDVVITGVGMVTPLGATAPESAAAWQRGESSLLRPSAELAGTPLEEAEIAVLPEIDAAQRLGSRRMLKFMSEAGILAAIAAHDAVADAGIAERTDPTRIGLYAATGIASANVDDTLPMLEASIDASGQFSCQMLGAQGLAATNPLLSFKMLANMPPCIVSISEHVQGPSYIFTPWEGQAGAAIMEGWHAVSSGEVDAALVGGADAAGQPTNLVYLRQAGLISADEWPASGAAYAVLERAEVAERAGRKAYARIISLKMKASTCPPYDPLAHRIGRLFAAAPAVMLCLAALGCTIGDGKRHEQSILGVDEQEFCLALDVLS